MNAQTRIVPDIGRTEAAELREQLQEERLKVIRLQGMARRCAWALRACLSEAEVLGSPPSLLTYWREMADRIERETVQ
jgi:glycosyltransferase A (GT-A) superfamily protein (DUF2064 family)